MSKKVAILGCGPAGLLAAHAANMAGADINIFSIKRKSEMFGAQYLHDDIPGIVLSNPVTVRYKLLGSASAYRTKVYGPSWTGSVSPEDLEKEHKAWDIREAYTWLWHRYSDAIINGHVDPKINDGYNFRQLIASQDLVVNTIPRQQMCAFPWKHKFRSQRVWAVGDAPERGVFCPVPVAEDNLVVCNGMPDVSWYRASRIYGYKTAEWSEADHKKKPPFEGLAEVQKPLWTDCGCWPEVLNVGRYGKWEKGVLSHSAFYEVFERLV